MAEREGLAMKARELAGKAFAALASPVGVRLTGPIVEAPGRVAFLAHRSGFTADREPMSDAPFAIVRLQSQSGELIESAAVRAGDAIHRLFPEGLTPLEEHVVRSESPEAYRIAHRIREQLQPRVIALYDRQRPLDDNERADASAFGLAFWRVLWRYELPAYEALGGGFLTWLDANGAGQ